MLLNLRKLSGAVKILTAKKLSVRIIKNNDISVKNRQAKKKYSDMA